MFSRTLLATFVSGLTLLGFDNSSAQVSSFNSRTGAVTLSSTDVTGALGYTPANRAGDTFSGFLQIIPALLKTDTGPLSGSDGSDAIWIVDEEAPGALAGVEDVLVGFPDQGAEFVLAQIGPDVLHGIELG